jgi:hypothetical protein
MLADLLEKACDLIKKRPVLNRMCSYFIGYATLTNIVMIDATFS